MASVLYETFRQKYLEVIMGAIGPNTLPEPNRNITTEEIITVMAALVHQMGGSAVIDSVEFVRIREQNKTVQIQTQNDPWRMILRVVDN